MKLLKEDREFLLKNGYLEEDFRKIEESSKKTALRFNFEKRITQTEAIRLLGRERFISGLSRSAFHHTAVREVLGSDVDVVSFDASAYFKE